MDSNPLIFVHSSFRTGSTYIRSCFRKNPKALTYQEIFNENLANLQPENIGSFNSGNWHSKHPLIAPYFLEFHPLIAPEGGVKGYQASMSYDSFFPGESDDLTNAEVSYVTSLIEHARELGRIPVLTATRSLGRLAALKKAFGGLHILLYRNIFHQWCSYTEQWLRGNPSFIETVWLTLKGAHNEKITSDIARIFASDNRSALDPNNFFAFVLLHTYLYARAGNVATFIIDIDELSTNSGVRASLEHLIRDHTGLEVDFSEARQSMAFSLVDIGSERVLSDTINAFPQIQKSARTPDGIKFGEKVVNDLVSEYRNYWRYAGPLVQLANRKTEQLASQQSEIATQHAEIERQHAAIAGLQGEIQRQHGEFTALQTEIQRRHGEIAALQAEIQRQQGEVVALQAEIQRQHGEVVALQAEIQRRHGEILNLTMEAASMRQSTSWRITSPMRAIKAGFKTWFK